MWKTRYNNIYKCKDPNLVITSVCAFPNVEDTIDKCNSYYKIDSLNNDLVYRELIAYIELTRGGRDFIPIAFSDKVPKLNKLQELKPVGKSYFWCIGYVSKYLKGGSKSINAPYRSIDEPTFETLFTWFKHHVKNYNDSDSITTNHDLHKKCLIKYIYDYIDNNNVNVNRSRVFQLIQNSRINIQDDRKTTTYHWIDHIENLKNRDIYEIIVNDFI